MATYENITREEMESFLFPQGFKALALDGTRELVYAKRVDADGLPLSLRVYTGINPDGNSRDVGADAIRCNIFWRNSDGKLALVATSKRVNRVRGWQTNLDNRIRTTHQLIERKCSCGSPMVKRAKRGTKEFFLGCANYPTCKKTERVS